MEDRVLIFFTVVLFLLPRCVYADIEVGRLVKSLPTVDNVTVGFAVVQRDLPLPDKIIKREIKKVESLRGNVYPTQQADGAVRDWRRRQTARETKYPGRLLLSGERMRWETSGEPPGDFFSCNAFNGNKTTWLTQSGKQKPRLDIRPGFYANLFRSSPYLLVANQRPPVLDPKRLTVASSIPQRTQFRSLLVMRSLTDEKGANPRWESRIDFDRVQERILRLTARCRGQIAEDWQFQNWKDVRQGVPLPMEIHCTMYAGFDAIPDRTIPDQEFWFRVQSVRFDPIADESFDLNRPASGSAVQDRRFKFAAPPFPGYPLGNGLVYYFSGKGTVDKASQRLAGPASPAWQVSQRIRFAVLIALGLLVVYAWRRKFIGTGGGGDVKPKVT